MNHMDKRLTEWNHRLSKAQARLDSASPERVLGRGYALVRPLEGGSYLKNPQDLQLGQALEVQLSEGRFEAEVTGLKKA
jgi:exonuclease VII large subunit